MLVSLSGTCFWDNLGVCGWKDEECRRNGESCSTEFENGNFINKAAKKGCCSNKADNRQTFHFSNEKINLVGERVQSEKFCFSQKSSF